MRENKLQLISNIHLRDRLSFSYVITVLFFFLEPHCCATSVDLITLKIPSSLFSHFMMLSQDLGSFNKSLMNSHRWYTLEAAKNNLYYSIIIIIRLGLNVDLTYQNRSYSDSETKGNVEE